MIGLLGLKEEQIKQLLKNEPAYRVKQILFWLYKGVSFEEMNNLPLSLRKTLRENYSEGYLREISADTDSQGTIKYLFACDDDNTLETVFMQKDYGNTLCISTQIGCKMGCVFCASCKGGFLRNLTAAEILSQVICVNANFNEERAVKNIVLMGMGEPLDNYDNVLEFIRMATGDLGISQRNISLSTCGLINQIHKLTEEEIKLTLAISLHAPNQQKREEIIPTAKNYPINEIIAAANSYFLKTGRRIIIEYTLIEGFNDNNIDAEQLSILLRGLNCHVNLIPLNDFEGLRAPKNSVIYGFCDTLKDLGVSATVRRSMGSDILGACGQLRWHNLQEREQK